MEATVDYCFVDKKYFDIQKKEIFIDNDRLLEHIICQDVMNIMMHADFVPVNVLSVNNKCLVNDNQESEPLIQENDHLFELLLSQDIVHISINSLTIFNNYAKIEQDYTDEYSENLVLKVELAKKEHMVEKNLPPNMAKVIAPGMFKLDLELLSPKSFTSASRSQPSGNTKNNKISQTTSRNKKNKAEEHSRSVKSNSNKMNHFSEPIYNVNVKHTMLNVNSELICVKCNQCMFDANHDVCFLEFVNDVNVRSKSKSSKSSKKKNIWKPTDERTESEKETTKSGKNDDDMSIDLDETNEEEDEHVDDETQRDEYVNEDDVYVHEEEEHVHDYVEEDLNDAKIAKTVEGDKQLTYLNKVEVGKVEEVKGDKEQVDNALARVDQAKDTSTQDNQEATFISVTQKGKPKLPPTSSSLSVSS
nr:hypothetical protein [Tanacetum cinerariifolium]